MEEKLEREISWHGARWMLGHPWVYRLPDQLLGHDEGFPGALHDIQGATLASTMADWWEALPGTTQIGGIRSPV